MTNLEKFYPGKKLEAFRVGSSALAHEPDSSDSCIDCMECPAFDYCQDVEDKTFLINEANILYVQLGDGSVPKDKALSVDICMLDQKHITIINGTNAEAKETYNKIRKRLIADLNLTDL